MKCTKCGCLDNNLIEIDDHKVCDLCLMDILNIVDPTDTRETKPTVTKCPDGYADGYNDLQPNYVLVGLKSKKPSLDELDKALNTFIPKVL